MVATSHTAAAPLIHANIRKVWSGDARCSRTVKRASFACPGTKRTATASPTCNRLKVGRDTSSSKTRGTPSALLNVVVTMKVRAPRVLLRQRRSLRKAMICPLVSTPSVRKLSSWGSRTAICHPIPKTQKQSTTTGSSGFPRISSREIQRFTTKLYPTTDMALGNTAQRVQVINSDAGLPCPPTRRTNPETPSL